MGKFRQRLIDPFVMAVVFIAVIWFILMGIGKIFIGVYEGGNPDRLDRPELWIGTGILVGVIALMGFLATRPKGALGPIEKDVVIGSQPFFDDSLPPVDASAPTEVRPFHWYRSPVGCKVATLWPIML